MQQARTVAGHAVRGVTLPMTALDVITAVTMTSVNRPVSLPRCNTIWRAQTNIRSTKALILVPGISECGTFVKAVSISQVQ